MQRRRFYDSLRFKATVGVLAPLLVILSILAYVRHIHYRNLLMENLRRSAADAGKIIEGSLQHAVLTNDFSTLRQIVDNIGKQQGVEDVVLLDKSGQVLISVREQMRGVKIDLHDATCQACHQYEAASRNASVILTLDGGKKVFRNVDTIENAHECQTCHDPEVTTLGVLISDFDMTPIDGALDMDRRNSLLWSAGSILLILLTTSLLTSKMVIGRLEQFSRAIQRVSAGDLDVRVESTSADEISELANSFNRMADGLREKARLEESLQEQAKELVALNKELRQEETLRRRLLERLITVQEEERKRIALELHDETGQPLTSLIMSLGLLGETQSVQEVREHVPELRDTAVHILKQVHDLALELRPSILDDLGLMATLRHLHKGFEDRFRIPVDLQVMGLDHVRLSSEIETALYRIVQEALTNVARHAQASSVSVLLEKRGNSVILIVEDDGQGFDVSRMMDAQLQEKKLGLYGMRERANMLGGKLTFESTPGTGTAIFVEIPLETRKDDDGQDTSAGRG